MSMCVSVCRRGIPVYPIGLYGSSVLVRPVDGKPSLMRGVVKLGDNEHVLLVNTLSHWHDMVWVGHCGGGRTTNGRGVPQILSVMSITMAAVLTRTPDFSMLNTSSWYLPASRWLAHPLISCSLEMLCNTHNVNSLAVMFCRMIFAAHPTAIDLLMKSHATHTELCWWFYDAVTNCTS